MPKNVQLISDEERTLVEISVAEGMRLSRTGRRNALTRSLVQQAASPPEGMSCRPVLQHARSLVDTQLTVPLHGLAIMNVDQNNAWVGNTYSNGGQQRTDTRAAVDWQGACR